MNMYYCYFFKEMPYQSIVIEPSKTAKVSFQWSFNLRWCQSIDFRFHLSQF